MRMLSVLIGVLVVLSCAQDSLGMATEQVGPASVQRFPTTAQPGWPAGIVELLRHRSRVYSVWCNGNENFYFKASPEEINDLIHLFSKIRMRDHGLWIKPGKRHVKSFGGDKIDYNVDLHVLGGIALWGRSQRDEGPSTYEPTLTVYVDPNADQAFLKRITLPDNIILGNEVANCPLKGKATKPKRKAWYAQVQFDDSTPAEDSEHGLTTKITLWEKRIKEGINVGEVSREGYFRAALSDEEITDLKSGKSWLTMTVGNWLTEAKSDHPRLSVEKLALDRTTAQPVKVNKPAFYHGRILFEDGLPPVLAPAPWPGAKIHLDFPYAGGARIDSEGYFKVYFTREQYEEVAAGKARKNIYVPSYEEKNTSTARFVFPVSELSQDKEKAGLVRIPRPGPKKDR